MSFELGKLDLGAQLYILDMVNGRLTRGDKEWVWTWRPSFLRMRLPVKRPCQRCGR